MCVCTVMFKMIFPQNYATIIDDYYKDDQEHSISVSTVHVPILDIIENIVRRQCLESQDMD